jgi:Mor family transcriptional regulator
MKCRYAFIDGIVKLCGEKAAEKICRDFGGSQQYLPKSIHYTAEARMAYIRKNHLKMGLDKLARETDCTQKTVRSIIKKIKAESTKGA